MIDDISEKSMSCIDLTKFFVCDMIGLMIDPCGTPEMIINVFPLENVDLLSFKSISYRWSTSSNDVPTSY